LIDQDDLHAAARHTEHRLELPPHALDDPREPRRQRLLALVRVEVEMRRANRLEPQLRIVAPGRGGARRVEQHRQQKKATDEHRVYPWPHSAASFNSASSVNA
jgi:hypothetical protein